MIIKYNKNSCKMSYKVKTKDGKVVCIVEVSLTPLGSF